MFRLLELREIIEKQPCLGALGIELDGLLRQLSSLGTLVLLECLASRLDQHEQLFAARARALLTALLFRLLTALRLASLVEELLRQDVVGIEVQRLGQRRDGRFV